MGLFDRASKKVTDTMNLVQKKTSDTIAVNKIKMQMKNMQGEIDTLCLAVGKRVYTAHVNGTEAELNDLFEGIEALNRRVAEAQVELDKLNAVIRCENCGEALNEGARFCVRCGTPVKEKAPEAEAAAEEGETCPKCGAKREDGARFCNMCGHDYEEVAEKTENTENAE